MQQIKFQILQRMGSINDYTWEVAHDVTPCSYGMAMEQVQRMTENYEADAYMLLPYVGSYFIDLALTGNLFDFTGKCTDEVIQTEIDMYTHKAKFFDAAYKIAEFMEHECTDDGIEEFKKVALSMSLAASRYEKTRKTFLSYVQS